jgi:hypothetical protein
MKKYAWAVVLFMALVSPAASGSLEAGDVPAAGPLAPARFLVGSWSTAGLNRPEEGTGVVSFSLELDRSIILRKNRVEFPPKKQGEAVTVHEDLMVIFPEAGGFRAIYFDNEKHVIEYGVVFPENERAAVFESKNASGPRFRLVHKLLADGTLASEFYIAQPGGEFNLYLKGAARRCD